MNEDPVCGFRPAKIALLPNLATLINVFSNHMNDPTSDHSSTLFAALPIPPGQKR
jgi:hypothetical protein